MANKGKQNNSKRGRRTEVEKMAFTFGLVQRGLKNPDSRISESYQNGLKAPEQKKKKSLF